MFVILATLLTFSVPLVPRSVIAKSDELKKSEAKMKIEPADIQTLAELMDKCALKRVYEPFGAYDVVLESRGHVYSLSFSRPVQDPHKILSVIVNLNETQYELTDLNLDGNVDLVRQFKRGEFEVVYDAKMGKGEHDAFWQMVLGTVLNDSIQILSHKKRICGKK